MGFQRFEVSMTLDGNHGGLVCYKCGQTGHKRAECPQRKQKPPPSGVCYKCNQEGHRQRDCPQHRGSASAGGSVQSQSTQVVPVQQSSVPVQPGTAQTDVLTVRSVFCFKCNQEGHKKKDCPLRESDSVGGSVQSQLMQSASIQQSSVPVQHEGAAQAATSLQSVQQGEGAKDRAYAITSSATETSVLRGKIQIPHFVLDSAKAEYAAFEEKVRRTIYVDNLSPQVSETVLKTAFDQFGNVREVQFIANYVESSNVPHCALVEMDSPELARKLVEAMSNQPFMIHGMPRPVRACAAEMEMFEKHPQKPGRKLTCCWLDPQDPDFNVAKKLKHLTRKHAAEASFLLQHQLEEERKLASHQLETLESNYKKYELIEKVLRDGAAKSLGHRYGMKEFDAR